MTATLRDRFGRLDACALSDALDRLGLQGSVGAFQAWGGTRLLVGRARTVTLAPGAARRPQLHLGARALATAGPDDVIVVANAGRRDVGAWGGLLTLQARLRGVAGVVVDGALRDASEVDLLGVPILARGTSPRSARGRLHEVATDVAVIVDGVRVEPGAWVIGDSTGVAFIPAGQAARVARVAEDIVAEEAGMAEALRAGLPVCEVLGSRYERMLDNAHE